MKNKMSPRQKKIRAKAARRRARACRPVPFHPELEIYVHPYDYDTLMFAGAQHRITGVRHAAIARMDRKWKGAEAVRTKLLSLLCDRFED